VAEAGLSSRALLFLFLLSLPLLLFFFLLPLPLHSFFLLKFVEVLKESS
jgi:hypothetical protein